MAKKKTDDVVASFDEITGMDSEFEKNGILVRDFTKESTISEWIDTGVYAVNGIISGRLVGGGVPCGRMMEISGKSGTGKSFFMRRIAKGAQDAGYLVIYIDTENAETVEGFLNSGLDVYDRHKFQYFNTASIDAVETLIAKKCKAIAGYNSKVSDDEKIKAIIVLDSLGMLRTKTEVENNDKGEYSADMGRRAKDIGRLLRTANDCAMLANVAVIFTNHVYDDPSPFASKTFDKSSGGNKVAYVVSTSIQIRSSMNKEENEDASGMSDLAYGENLKIRAKKTRFVIPFLEANLYIDFRRGLSKYSGLLDIAEKIGFVKKNGQKYQLKTGEDADGEPVYGEEIGKASEFDNEKFWEEHISALDEEFQKECSLSRVPPKIKSVSDDDDK